MRAPLSWLRDFAPFDLPPEELARVFDDLGMVVEAVERVGEGLAGVVLGRVLEVAPIEGARVRRTRVDIGPFGSDVQIVCGAANVAAGQLVPVATVGAVLPGGFEIGERTVRGVTSHGMICSARELGLGDDAEGIMVLDEVGQPGQSFAAVMGIERDVVFDLAIETNRPDANCVAGIARDAAARLGLPFAIPDAPDITGYPAPDDLPSITSPAEVPRFSVTVLDGVTVGPSPSWMARRLTLAGMRPINNLVDISNYVMLELGQPTHPYDLDRLPGGTLGARQAVPGEVVTTLDDVARSLGSGPTPDIVITDGANAAVGIAGIMGGASSEIHEGTRRVLLEAAHFDRLTIAKTSQRLGLRSEASARFERGVDPMGIELSVGRFCQLATQLAGAKPTAWAMVESPSHVPSRFMIRVRTSRVSGLLGTEVNDSDIKRLLRPIGFRVESVEPGLNDVTPPTFRLDCEQEADIVEEVGRHLGYSSIPRTVPRSPMVGGLTVRQRERRLLRDVLIGTGIDEAATGVLIGPGDHARAGRTDLEASLLRAADPLALEESVMRRSLRPGLLKAAAFNLGRRIERVAMFEVAAVFHPTDGTRPVERVDAERCLPDEVETVAVITVGEGGGVESVLGAWRNIEAALRLDGAVLRAVEDEPGMHPTRTAVILGRFGDRLGLIGEVDPAVAAGYDISGPVGWMETDLDAMLAHPRLSAAAQPVSRFPSADIDLAFVVPDPVPVDEVHSTIARAGGEVIEWVRLFDTYRGEGVAPGSRSLAFRVRFVAQDHTLSDGELGTLRQACIDAVERRHGATLR